MTRHVRPYDDADDSEASFLPQEEDCKPDIDDASYAESVQDESLFDVDDDEQSCAGSDIDDPCDYGNPRDYCEDKDVDPDDIAQLFDGDLYPPEYWRKAVEEFNESQFDGEDYAPGSTALLDGIDDQWSR